MPFEVSLRVQNRTRYLQELTLRMGDTTGFVLAGEKMLGLESCPESIAATTLTDGLAVLHKKGSIVGPGRSKETHPISQDRG